MPNGRETLTTFNSARSESGVFSQEFAIDCLKILNDPVDDTWIATQMLRFVLGEL